MATEMPIPQDYNRFVDPIPDDVEPLTDTGESILDVLEDIENEPEVEELPDGSAIVRLPDVQGPEDTPDFYENLADAMPSYELNAIAIKYIDLIEKDKEAREGRDKQYEEGLKRTGLGNDAPGGATFMGASKVVHPVMAEACVDFAARAIKELFPPDGPVRTKIVDRIRVRNDRISKEIIPSATS